MRLDLDQYVHTGQEVLIANDLGQDSPIDVSEWVALGFRAYAGIPLLHRQQSLGTISLFSHPAASGISR